MAPLSEEWVFRSCMMPLLLQCLDPLTAVFIGPFLFGIGKYIFVMIKFYFIILLIWYVFKIDIILFSAHFHHLYELMAAGRSFKSAFLISGMPFILL